MTVLMTEMRDRRPLGRFLIGTTGYGKGQAGVCSIGKNKHKKTSLGWSVWYCY